MIVQVAFILTLAAVMWLSSTAVAGAPRDRWPWAWTIGLLAPLLAAVALTAATRTSLPELRLRAGAVRFLSTNQAAEPAAARSPVVIVGSRRTDVDLLVPNAPETLASMHLEPPDSAPAELAVTYLPMPDSSSVGQPGVVLAEWGSKRMVVGAVAVAPGDRVEIDAAGGPATVEVVASNAVRSAGTDLSLKWSVRLPLFGVWRTFRRADVRSRTYPLAAILEQQLTDRVPLASFFFFEPDWSGLRGRLQLALLDPSVRVVKADGTVMRYSAAHRVPLVDGAPLRVRICGLGVPSEALGTGHEYLGVRDFRSAIVSGQTLENGTRVLQASFDTIETLNFTPELLARLQLDDEEVSERRRWHLTLVPDVLVPKAITFLTLPPSFGPSGQAILEEGQDGAWSARVPAGAIPLQYGRAIWLGDTAQAAVQIDRMQPTWVLAAWIALAALSSVWLLTGIAPPRGSLFALLVAINVILSFKLLLGLKAWTGTRHSFESFALALYALMVMPLVIAVATARGRAGADRPTLTLAHLVLHALATAVVGWTLLGLPAALIALAVPLALFYRPASDPGPFARVRAMAADVIAFATARPTLYALAAGGALLGIRGVLAVIGYRERVPLGVPVAISILYIPAVLLGYAVLRVGWVRSGRQSISTYLLGWSVYFGLAAAATGVVVSDFGVPLLLLVPLGLDLVLLSWSAAEVRHSRRAQAAAVALAMVFAAGLATWRFMPERIVSAMGWSGPGASLLDWDRNKLRFLYYTYPAAVREIGRRESEELLVMNTVLARYTATGTWGRGYPQAEISPQLGPTALREHVPAVFLAGDFGHAGVTIVAMAYLLILIACSPGRSEQEERETSVGPAFGRLAAATFVCSSLYMIAANYDMVPFTGKNAYLLGLDSFSDLVESLALLGLAVTFCFTAAAAHADTVERPA